MSANLESAIQEKVRRLDDEQQKQVMAFVEGLEPKSREQSGTRFSFVGIARSGKRSLSIDTESGLTEGAERREGWSLP